MISRHISCVLHADAGMVYDVIIDPERLPAWAAGLARAELRRDGADLIATSSMGEVRVRFVARNQYGIADHDVTLPSGVVVNNPVRVLVHPYGCEVVFTVRQLDLTDDEFERDCATVAHDLARLKALVEP